MISNEKDLYQFIDGLLKNEGYIKKKDTWYLHTLECICFFSIGKSPFSGQYDNIMGCFLKELNTVSKECPEYYKCDLRYSLENFVETSLVKRVFNLENSEFTGNEREFIIKELIQVYVIPFLRDVSTKAGIKEAVNKYEDLIYSINLDLKEYLSIK